MRQGGRMSPENADTRSAQATAPVVSETEYVRAADFKTYYTNHVQAGLTPFDISLEIGEASGLNRESNKWVVDVKAKITMSPSEAKVVLLILSGTIKTFEDQFGTIVIPSAVGVGQSEAGTAKTEGV